MALSADNDLLGSHTANTAADTSLPIFNVERVQLNFNIASEFVAGQVANNVLILALATNRILRIDLENPSDIDGRRETSEAASRQLTCCRCRPTQAKQRGRPHTAHVPRPDGITLDYQYYPWREFLPP